MGCGESKDAQVIKNPKVDLSSLTKNTGQDPTAVVIPK